VGGQLKMKNLKFKIKQRAFKRLVLVAVLVFVFSFFTFTFVKAQDCGTDLDCQISQIQKEIDALSPAQEKNKQDLTALNKQIADLNFKISKLTSQLKSLEIQISGREKDLVYTKAIFDEKAKGHYTFLRLYDPITPFLFSDSASQAFQEIVMRQKAADSDRKVMEEYATDLSSLKTDKETLEKSKVSLSSLQSQVAEKQKFLAGEVAKVETYLSILSSKQQELLAAKFSSAPVPLLAYTSLGGCSSDIGKSSGFSPRYGFFTYGVPNKTGLNQYGAKGRAENGQPYSEILNAYYANFQIVDYGTGFNIRVNGTNDTYKQTFNNETYNIEEYLKHLYEMPTSWDSKALQAQAIAARSYALARTNNGQNSIPPDESGQVVKKELNDQRWIDAVVATSGKVMVQNGRPISAWYSSTHGGVILRSGQIGWADSAWTKQAIDNPSNSAGNFSELKSNAYDKQSPWFFCDWGYRKEYNSTAWLKEEEVVDIVNAYILWEKDSSTIIHLSQTDKSTGDTWSAERVRQEIVNKSGSPINSIGSINIPWDSSGISKNIIVNGRSFDAQKFKNLFNIRAPGNIQIKPSCQPDSGLNCPKMYALYEVVKE